MKFLVGKEPVTRLENVINKLFYVHYDSQFLGTVAARTWPEAVRKAKGKFGTHIIKNDNYLEVVNSNK